MSLPSQLTVILTTEMDGVLMGIFIDDMGRFQYPNGRVTHQMDMAAWWTVPEFTKARGVDQSGYYYVLQANGYYRCTTMVNQPGGGVAFRVA